LPEEESQQSFIKPGIKQLNGILLHSIILKDTIATGIVIARREFHVTDDDDSKTKYLEIYKGINQFTYFVFEGCLRIDDAQVASARAAYLAAIILTGFRGKPETFDEKMALQGYLIVHPEYNFLNKRLKFIARGEALFYWYCTLQSLYPENSS
jgi:hypothetical protein